MPHTDAVAQRDVFSQNLKVLMGDKPNVSQVCRDIGINRTQFNRYLGGTSWPRPDVLVQICTHFDTDARVLTTPLSEFSSESDAIADQP
ncbi:MAG: helix-turn-helix transcriptional regulator [Pseudomonadota bacterium]